MEATRAPGTAAPTPEQRAAVNGARWASLLAAAPAPLVPAGPTSSGDPTACAFCSTHACRTSRRPCQLGSARNPGHRFRDGGMPLQLRHPCLHRQSPSLGALSPPTCRAKHFSHQRAANTASDTTFWTEIPPLAAPARAGRACTSCASPTCAWQSPATQAPFWFPRSPPHPSSSTISQRGDAQNRTHPACHQG